MQNWVIKTTVLIREKGVMGSTRYKLDQRHSTKKIVKNITQGSHDYTCYIIKKCMNAPNKHNAYYENTAFTWGTFMEKLELMSYGEVPERKHAGLAGRV